MHIPKLDANADCLVKTIKLVKVAHSEVYLFFISKGRLTSFKANYD